MVLRALLKNEVVILEKNNNNKKQTCTHRQNETMNTPDLELVVNEEADPKTKRGIWKYMRPAWLLAVRERLLDFILINYSITQFIDTL